jgi:hypothetical protein
MSFSTSRPVLSALRHVHLLMNVLHRDLLVSARSLHAMLATDPKLKAKFMKMAAWYRDRALEIARTRGHREEATDRTVTTAGRPPIGERR